MKKIIILIVSAIISAVYVKAQERLTLNQCLDQAVIYNHSLQKAALDIQSAKEQKKEAFTNYLPNISANVAAFYAFDKIVKSDGLIPPEIAILGEEFIPMIGMPFSVRELDKGYFTTLSIFEPLYAGGQITTGNKLANIQKEVMVLQKALTEKDVLQKVTENYWQIASIKYNKEIIDAAEKQLDEVYKQVELFVKTGVTTRNNLLKVKLHQKELASNRLKLENGEKILRMLLAQQIGHGNKDIDIVLPEDEKIATPESVQANVANAVSNRIEMQLAGIGVNAQKLQVKMEIGKNLPTFAVGFMGYHTGLGGISEDMKSYMPTRMTNGLVLGTLSVPISSWFGGRHAIRRQKIKLEQAKIDYTDAQELLQIDIESAWNNLTEAYKQIELAETMVEESNENLRMSNDLYKVGKETITDLLDAETLNRQAKSQLAEAKANYQVRLCDYLRKVK